MSDDEFLKQFRKVPHGAFTRQLYAQLTEEDEMNHSLTIPAAVPLMDSEGARVRVKPYWMTLAAAMLALVLFGGLLLYPHTSPQTPQATQQPLLKNLQPITLQNAGEVKLLEEIGRGVVTDVAWSPDGKIVALAGTKGVWLHDAADLQAEPRLLQAPDVSATRRLAISADSRWIAATDGNDVIVWDAESGTIVAHLKAHHNRVNAAAFSPDGRWLATGGGAEDADVLDNTIRLWDTATWQVSREITGQSYVVTNLAFSPDGKILASENLNRNDAVYLWDAASGTLLNILKRTSASLQTRGIAFSPDGQTLALADSANTIIGATLWDVGSGKKRGLVALNNQFSLYFGGYIHDLAYSPDGNMLATGTDVLQLWDFQSVSFVPDFAEISTLPSVIEDYRLAFSPDGSKLATIRNSGDVAVIDLKTHQSQVVSGYNRGVGSIALTPDNLFVLYATQGYVHTYDLETQREKNVRDLGIFSGPLGFSSDGTVIAFGGFFKPVALFGYMTRLNNGLQLMNMQTGDVLATVAAGTQNYGRVVFSPNDRFLVVTTLDQGSASAYRWDFGQQSPFYSTTLFENRAGDLWNVAFSADSQQLLLSGDGGNQTGSIVILDPESGHVLHTVDLNEAITGAIFHPDGDQLAVGGQDHITLMAIKDGSTIRQLDSAARYPNPLAFSPDGRALMGQDNDALMLWDTETGEAIPLLQKPPKDTTVWYDTSYVTVAVSSDWRFFVTGTYDGILRVYGVPGQGD